MNAMTEQQVLEVLANVGLGSKIFVSYVAGRRNTSPRAAQERARAEEEGLSLRHFTGTFEGLKRNAKRQAYVLLWALERDSVKDDGTTTEGNFRAMNPSLGRMVSITVLDPISDCWFAL